MFLFASNLSGLDQNTSGQPPVFMVASIQNHQLQLSGGALGKLHGLCWFLMENSAARSIFEACTHLTKMFIPNSKYKGIKKNTWKNYFSTAPQIAYLDSTENPLYLMFHPALPFRLGGFNGPQQHLSHKPGTKQLSFKGSICEISTMASKKWTF